MHRRRGRRIVAASQQEEPAFEDVFLPRAPALRNTSGLSFGPSKRERLSSEAASGGFGGMVHMHWIYYVLAGAAVIVLINVLFILYLARSASRDSE
jgi:hypothetical protein